MKGELSRDGDKIQWVEDITGALWGSKVSPATIHEQAKAVMEELRAMKLKAAAKKVEDGIEETLTYCDFPSKHWTRICTNNMIEHLRIITQPPERHVSGAPSTFGVL